MMTRRIVAGWTALLLSSFTACTFGVTDEGSVSGVNSVPPVHSSSPRASVQPSPIASGTVSHIGIPPPVAMPLVDYLDALQQMQQASADQRYLLDKPVNDRLQGYIAQCMKSAGFDYHKLPLAQPVVDTPLGGSLGLPWLPDSREQVSIHAYGTRAQVTTIPDFVSNEELLNAEYESRLSAAARREYWFTLTGHDGYDVGSTPGCIEMAEKEIGTLPSASQSDPTWLTDIDYGIKRLFFTYRSIEPTQRLVPGSLQANPDMQLLNREWAQCAKSKGTVQQMTLEQLQTLGPLVSYSLAMLNDNPSEVRELALADYDCRHATDYVNRYSLIQVRAEEVFINENKASLDQLMATWEQQSKSR